MEEEVPRCILGKRELGQAESEELRQRERSHVFIRAMMDGVHLRMQPIRGLVTAFRSFNSRMFQFSVAQLRTEAAGPHLSH